MAFSMDAARIAAERRICDVCEAPSAAARGTTCPTCAAGILRYRSELQLIRERRRAVRRAARAQALRP
jgi:hypothetical protein